jgi:hypothetical protein
MAIEDLTLKHVVLGFDAGGWLKLRKRNGEEIAVQLEPEEMMIVADWLDAASDQVGGAKRNSKDK